MTDPDSSQERRIKLEELLSYTFNTSPVLRGHRPPPCEECKEGIIEQSDKVRDAGSKVQITILYFCRKCGWYKIGDPYYDDDY